jgi:hypothetical protein
MVISGSRIKKCPSKKEGNALEETAFGSPTVGTSEQASPKEVAGC